jgi:hypothetical protein
MQNVSLNNIKKTAVQKAEAKCYQLVDDYALENTGESIEIMKEQINRMLMLECIRFFENLILSQYYRIAPL